MLVLLKRVSPVQINRHVNSRMLATGDLLWKRRGEALHRKKKKKKKTKKKVDNLRVGPIA